MVELWWPKLEKSIVMIVIGSVLVTCCTREGLVNICIRMGWNKACISRAMSRYASQTTIHNYNYSNVIRFRRVRLWYLEMEMVHTYDDVRWAGSCNIRSADCNSLFANCNWDACQPGCGVWMATSGNLLGTQPLPRNNRVYCVRLITYSGSGYHRARRLW